MWNFNTLLPVRSFKLLWSFIKFRWLVYDTDWVLICSSKQKKQKGRSQRLHYQPISVKHADLYVWSYWLTRVGDEWPMTVGREHQTVPTAGWSVSDRSRPRRHGSWRIISVWSDARRGDPETDCLSSRSAGPVAPDVCLLHIMTIMHKLRRCFFYATKIKCFHK